MTQPTGPNTIFEMEGLSTKSLASEPLRNLNLSLSASEIHAVVSDQAYALENLLRIFTDDAVVVGGSIRFLGEKMTMRALQKQKRRMFIISQKDSLYPEFTVYENLFYFSPLLNPLSEQRRIRRCQQLLKSLNIPLELNAKVSSLQLHERKIVELIRAYVNQPKLIVIHDIVSLLGTEFTPVLTLLMDRCKSDGVGILYLTTQVDFAISTADHISILRKGSITEHFNSDTAVENPERVINAYVGRSSLAGESVDSSELKLIDTITQTRSIMASGKEMRKALDFLTRSMCRVLGVTSTVLYLAATDGATALDIYASDNSGSQIQLPLERVYSLLRKDISQNVFQPELSTDYDIHDYSGMYVIPFRTNSQVQGLLQFLCRGEQQIGKNQREYIQTFIKEIAIVVEMSKTLEHSTLLQESHHRIKNNLQIIISLIYMQANKLLETCGSESADLINELTGTTISRIRSIATIHDLLSKDQVGWRMVNLEWMIRKIISFYARPDLHLELQIDSINIPYKRASSFALIINEMISNCIKHAFVNRPSTPTITIVCRDTQEQLVITIQDNGVGFPEGFKPSASSGVGMSVILSILRELKAEAQWGNDEGAKATFLIPHGEMYKI